MCIHIYIYMYKIIYMCIYIYIERERDSVSKIDCADCMDCVVHSGDCLVQSSVVRLATVSSRNFNAQHFTLRVSNPRTTAHSHFEIHFKSYNLPEVGPIFPDCSFEN